MQENFFGRIYFTEKDKDITGSSQRDPLGFQTVWSYFGRRVIKYLTTISNQLHGFREVLLCLSICEDLNHEDYGLKNHSDLIIIFEQLFMYSTIEHYKKENAYIEGFLGAGNGNLRYGQGNPVVSIKKTILYSQINYGYFGRYKSPMVEMGLIDKNETITDFTGIQELYDPLCYKNIKKDFISFLRRFKENTIGVEFNYFKSKENLFNAVLGTFRTGEKEFWLQKLGITGNINILMAEAFHVLNTKKELNAASVFTRLKSFNNPDIQNILNIEPFLCCMEEVFYNLFSEERIKDVVLKNFEIYKERYKKFEKIFDNLPEDMDDFPKQRIENIRKNCKPENPQQFAEAILTFHKDVCKKKKNEVWIENNNGQIQIINNVCDYRVDIKQWNRDYYLASLMEIKREFEVFNK